MQLNPILRFVFILLWDLSSRKSRSTVEEALLPNLLNVQFNWCFICFYSQTYILCPVVKLVSFFSFGNNTIVLMPIRGKQCAHVILFVYRYL
jgi:hypothetical protein